jgi:hypothetical protein
MAAEQPETDAFLAFIEQKIAALKALADSYKVAQSLGALGQRGEDAAFTFNGAVPPPPAVIDLPTGIFMGLSMPSAVKLLFATTKRKYTPAQVADALRDGGYESTSKNFEKMVGTTMYRMKDQGILLRFKDGFGLAELYPEHLRAKIGSKELKPARKKGKNVRRTPQRKGQTAPKALAEAPGPKALPAAS